MERPFQITDEMLAEVELEMEDPMNQLRRLAQTTAEPVPPPEDILSQRQQTHGDFRSNARLSQKLKAIFRSTDSWEHLDDVEKESLDMIALKFSRILSGKSLERQHWEDVVGYARLAEKECE